LQSEERLLLFLIIKRIVGRGAADIYIDWQLCTATAAAQTYLAEKYELGTASYEKFFFSTPELWLLWKAVKRISYQASWTKQHFAA
jgi:hypothetical protein